MALLIGTVAYFGYFLRALIEDPTALLGRMLVGLVLGVLWLAVILPRKPNA